MIYATVTLIIVMILSSSYGKIKQGNALPIIGSVLSLCIFSSCRSVSCGPDRTYYATQYTRVIPFLDYIEIIRQYTSGLMKDGIFYIFMKLCIDVYKRQEECGAKSEATLFHFKPQSPVDIPLRQAVEA